MATAKENLLGTEGQSRAFSRFGPQFQQQNDELLRNLLTQLGSQTQQGFQPIEDQARRDFQQKTLPSIAERFTSLGSNALSSPAYQSQRYGSAIDLDTNLAALKSQYGLQQNSQLMDLLRLLAPEQAYFTGQPGLIEGAAKGIAESAPSYFGAKGLEGDQEKKPWDLQGGLNTTGDILLSIAPFLSAVPGFGPLLTLGSGLIGGGLKLGGHFAGKNQQGQNFNAQQSELQKQLMNLGVDPNKLNQDLGRSATGNNFKYQDLSFKGPGGKGSPFGTIDFSQKSPGLNKIGALA